MSWAAVVTGVAGVATAGIGAATAGGDGGSAPPQLTPKQSLLSYIKGLEGGLPKLLTLESDYRSKFGNLNLADQDQFLDWVLSTGGKISGTTADQLQTARQKEFSNMRANLGSIADILSGIDPAGKQMAANATTMAKQAYDRAQGPLTFQEQRANDQASREAFAARGRSGDNISIMDELLGRENVKAAKRAEASTLGAQAFQMNQQFNSPALALLGGVPASEAMAQDYLTRAAGAVGANVPQLINPDAGMNMGMQYNANLASYQQAQAARSAGQSQMWGQVGSSLLGLAGDLYKNR